MRSAVCFVLGTALALGALCWPGQALPSNVQFRRSAFASSKDLVPLIVMIGESNSGGYADNADAKDAELAPRCCLQILNNETLQFEDLEIGKNNLVGHAGLVGRTHGWELQLANSVDAGDWGARTVYLVKAGQGGSRLAEWYRDGEYFRTFQRRVDAARTELEKQGKTPVVFVFGSIGINDHLAGMSVADYRQGLKEWVAGLRSHLGPVPVMLTDFMPRHEEYNQVIAEMEAISNTYRVWSRGARLRDENHWDYEGCKTVARRMIRTALERVADRAPFASNQP